MSIMGTLMDKYFLSATENNMKRMLIFFIIDAIYLDSPPF